MSVQSIRKIQPVSSAPRKRSHSNSDDKGHKNKKKKESEIWVDKYQPKDSKSLCLHSKKFQEVDLTISRAFKGEFRLILLVGPPGAGKTACIDVICQQSNLKKVQWANPARMSFLDANMNDCVGQESALNPFVDFLKREKYPALEIQTSSKPNIIQKQLVVIEDLPNIHDVLQRQTFETAVNSIVHATSPPPWPVVFIVSDTTKDDNYGTRLFASFQKEPKVATIRFNPIASTMMLKMLKSICTAEKIKISEEKMKRIIELSAGDLRNAINTLQFESLEPDEETPSKSKSKEKKNKEPKEKKEKPNDTKKKNEEGRDISLSLFHSLGKVLYNKRLDDPDAPPTPPPHYRAPMKSIPAEFQRHVHVDAGIFNEFIAENYLKFFGDIHDVAMASSYLSDSLHVMNTREPWKKTQLDDIAWYISCHGTMYANTHPAQNAWTPLYKPHLQTILKSQQNNLTMLKEIFSPNRAVRNLPRAEAPNLVQETLEQYSWMSGGLVEDILPYVSTLSKHPKARLKITPHQKSFLNIMSEYSERHNESQATRGSAKLTEFDTYYQQHEEEQNIQRRFPSQADNQEFYRMNAFVLAEDDIEEVD